MSCVILEHNFINLDYSIRKTCVAVIVQSSSSFTSHFYVCKSGECVCGCTCARAGLPREPTGGRGNPDVSELITSVVQSVDISPDAGAVCPYSYIVNGRGSREISYASPRL